MTTGKMGQRLQPYILILPAYLIIGLTMGYPIIYNIFASFWKWNLLVSTTPEQFVGLGNYTRAFYDPEFWYSLRITMVFVVLAVGLELLLGLGLALTADRTLERSRVLRVLLIIPMMITPVVAGVIWRVLWHSEFGVIEYFFRMVGGPTAWLTRPTTALAAVIITEVWSHMPFVFLILFGSLQMLSPEPYEAAMVDGANGWQRLVYLTLPFLRPAIMVALLFRTMFTFRIFDKVFALTYGGPGNATEVLAVKIYKEAFRTFEVGVSSSHAMILFFIAALLSSIFLRLLYRRGEMGEM